MDLPEVGDAMDKEMDLPDNSQIVKVAEQEEIGKQGTGKKLVKAGQGWETPDVGDEIEVHDIGTPLDGKQFDSSRDRGTPLRLKLSQGFKYNKLLKKHHMKCSEVETLRAKCENLISKCQQECQPKYEALEKQHNECQHLISEMEMLQAKNETLKKILSEECSERKRIYNELIDLRGNIRVFCRCRPLSPVEMSMGHTSIVDFDQSRDSELKITCSDSSTKLFKFDHVFSPADDQVAVFTEALPVIKSVMDGFNVCILAYGQTGTGKTFTMEGTPECRGVNYRALEELFSITKQRSNLMRYELYFSMLEVYNEKIRDLLVDESELFVKRLEIKQSAEGTQDVPGLSEVEVCNIDEAWDMLKSGGRNRAVGSTNANELSSRSHCLVRLAIKGENLISGERSKSFLWLVDLAGSERVGKIEAEGERLKESQFINKSLSALGDVISSLASKNSHIPYRNSKLTHLLQSSLGGDCKTLMFAQISPSVMDQGETLCTLNFASRVRGVEYGPARKQSDPVDSFKMKQMAEKLRMEEKEVAKLNESLKLLHIRYASRENVFRTLQEKIRESEQASKNYQLKIKDLENQLTEEKKEKIQLVKKEKTRSFRPPLAPTKHFPTLAERMNRLPNLAAQCSLAKATSENKENVLLMCKSITKPIGKVRRITLSPVLRNISLTKRRASFTTEQEKLTPLHGKQHLSHEIGEQLPKLMAARRRSVTSFVQPMTPQSKEGSSTLRYPGSSLLQNQWKSRFPNSIIPSPQQPLNKICYSVQKRLIVGATAQARPSSIQKRRIIAGSPAQAKPSICLQPRFDFEALQSKEIIGRFGMAQRVLRKNRRASVI